MLDERQFDDLREIFPVLVLFGDPAQLAPVGQSGEMVFDRLAASQKRELHRIHRQADDSPILDLAHALGDPGVDFREVTLVVVVPEACDELLNFGQRDLVAHAWQSTPDVRPLTAP